MLFLYVEQKTVMNKIASSYVVVTFILNLHTTPDYVFDLA